MSREQDILVLDLIRRAKADDISAIDQLISIYYDDIARAVANYIHRDQVQDVTQETFIRFHKIIDRYDPDKARLLHFLMGLARDISVDHIRKNRKYLLTDELSEERLLATSNPDSEFQAKEVEEIFNQGLKKLTNLQRSAAEMRIKYGFSYEEIADHFNVDVSVIKMRLHDATKNLRKILGGYFKLENVSEKKRREVKHEKR
jgi:RNA polymerase sigma-70 factor, ECF subfamily